jgi:transposase InsO family protein
MAWHGRKLSEDKEARLRCVHAQARRGNRGAHLAVAFEHYNDKHPHSALKYRWPREFRRRTDSSTLV